MGGPTSEDRPPLTAELFDGRFAGLSAYPDCLRIIPRLRAAVAAGGSIEEEMEAIRAQSQAAAPSLTQALTCMRGYLREVVANAEVRWHRGHDGVTNQMDLFDQVEGWREATGEKVRVVTFNYDTLAERAIESLGLRIGFGSPESYTADDRYRVFKLHGSTNWWRELVRVSEGGFHDPVPKDQVHFLPHEPAGNGRSTWAPAISVPLQTKTDSEFECPLEHLAMLKKDLPEVDRVISVGWRGQEAHFMELWRQHSPQFLAGRLCVSGSHESAQYVANQIAMNIKTATMPIIGDQGFSGFMSSKELQTWLDA